jgi:hypothetical protein
MILLLYRTLDTAEGKEEEGLLYPLITDSTLIALIEMIDLFASIMMKRLQLYIRPKVIMMLLVGSRNQISSMKSNEFRKIEEF